MHRSMRSNLLSQYISRNSLRGYKYALKTNSLHQVRELKNLLANTNPVHVSNSAFTREPCISCLPHDKILRQYLFQICINRSFINRLFYSIRRKNPTFFPLPKEWLKVLKTSSISIDLNLSRAAWISSLLLMFFINLLRSSLFFLRGLQLIGIDRSSRKYVYFSQLSDKNIPSASICSESYTVIDWYLQWNGQRNIDSVRHNVNMNKFSYGSVNISQGYLPFYLFKNLSEYLYLFRWFLYYLILSLADLFRGKWWSLLLAYEVLLAKSTSLRSRNFLAEDYMFHYSGLFFRPLWTYIVESKGSRVLTYFYSSYQNPSTNSLDKYCSEYWPASTWSHHLVWDSHQKDYLKKSLANSAKIESVGSIWFSDVNRTPTLPENSIAVFPLEFPRLLFDMPTSTYAELRYNHPNYFKLFINDILSVLSCYDYKMVLKLKRERTNSQRYGYIAKFLNQLRNNINVIIVDSDVSPLKLFPRSKGVISMPFTSTAHYTDIKSPNVYYDPTVWFDPKDSAAHGVPVISGKTQLKQWLYSNVIS